MDPAAVSGWHHHGTHALYGFLLSGRLRLEYGTTGSEAVTVSQGDFIHIPPGLVHRDVNPDRARGLGVVNILVGSGGRVVNVDRPGGPRDVREHREPRIPRDRRELWNRQGDRAGPRPA